MRHRLLRSRTGNRGGVLCAAALVLALWGCAAGPVPVSPAVVGQTSGVLIPDVPFYSQEAFACGPASLAAVLNHHGDGVKPAEIARALSTAEHRGTLTLDLVLYARERGFHAWGEPVSVETLISGMEGGQPAVAMVDLGIGPVRRPHFLVVVGFTRNDVIVNSGRTRHQKIPWGRFLGQWNRAGRWTLFLHGVKVPEVGDQRPEVRDRRSEIGDQRSETRNRHQRSFTDKIANRYNSIGKSLWFMVTKDP